MVLVRSIDNPALMGGAPAPSRLNALLCVLLPTLMSVPLVKVLI